MSDLDLVSINAIASSSFESAVQRVLQFLHRRMGFQLWMLTRTQGNDWIVLSANDHGYDVKPGDVFQWSDSFCSRMVEGNGPNIAPRCQLIPAYASAPIGRKIPIGAYVGLPLYSPDGSLFGTLCAIDPNPQSEHLQTELAMLELLVLLLSSLLHQELQAQENLRLKQKAEAEAQLDILTGIYNRRGWHYLLEAEEMRCSRYGLTAGIVVIDLDNLKQTNDQQGHAAGDRLLQRTAYTLQTNVRPCDIVSRIGGDEFAILIVESSREDSERVVQRIQHNLARAQISASLGWAMRSPTARLQEALEQADKAMYQNKNQRRQFYTHSHLS
ncbi:MULTISPECIES: sensor domain-containing diguanylate cyclase [unclassified Leptolyngbya]|uniref:sensor domain-containing diguanylate cyclase n=1 Tax=unclassified Leptolyngbya TaxID=2650499 RepID=UPI0016833D40|nr:MULTISPECIES: sensor domain-containing diguanylate cyclase [unclassified Leptolyngbya]MBD1913889.1 sensor domain-containing diguanylate cyclase [Leptolyngbya sp. FACHB-8]MBD2156341.1 sensor domain-containing diguanylate cyclase [Leptolyngbya sp. FACHB-16]